MTVEDITSQDIDITLCINGNEPSWKLQIQLSLHLSENFELFQ